MTFNWAGFVAGGQETVGIAIEAFDDDGSVLEVGSGAGDDKAVGFEVGATVTLRMGRPRASKRSMALETMGARTAASELLSLKTRALPDWLTFDPIA